MDTVDTQEFTMVIPDNKHVHRLGSRTYNRPTVEEVAVIIPEANLDNKQQQRVISLRKRGASGEAALQTIQSIHPNYDPLQFTNYAQPSVYIEIELL